MKNRLGQKITRNFRSDKTTYWHDGYHACCEGEVSEDGNPHAADTFENREWSDGWREAEGWA